MVDEQKLRELAGAATPGPWIACQYGDYGDYNGDCRVILGEGGDIRTAVVLGFDTPENDANAQLIAAANPAAILSLLDELQTLRVTAENAEKDAERYRWLRNESWAGYNNSKGKPQVFVHDGAGNRKTMLAEDAMDSEIDAAIDAAMKGES